MLRVIPFTKFLCTFTFFVLLQSCCTVYNVPVSINGRGGRAGIIAVHPNDDATMLVASETGGLFKTSDGGSHWNHIGSLPSYLVRSVAYCPDNPNIILATTSAQYRVEETGIWRSDDGGKTWAIPTNSRDNPGRKCPDIIKAHGITFDPDNSQRVYVATDCGLAISDDSGASWRHTIIDNSLQPSSDKLQNQEFSVLALPQRKVLVAGKDGVWYSDNRGGNWRKSVGVNNGANGLIQAFAVSPFSQDHIFFAYRQGNKSRLYLSTDGGQNYSMLEEYERGWARPLFVRTMQVNNSNFRVFFGDGVKVRQRDFKHSTTPMALGSWTFLPENHPDPSDIAINANGTKPLLLTSDGGVHTLQNGVWTMTGAAENGYNALQITEMTGQYIEGSNPHQDLYFGTQDNGVWFSGDEGETWPTNAGPEGFFTRVHPIEANHLNTKVTGVKCGSCSNFFTKKHFHNQSAWPNPPDGDTRDDIDGNPFLLSIPGHYIQRAINHDVTPITHQFKLTTDYGSQWTNSYIVSPNPVGRPAVAGLTNSPVIYQPVRRPGSTSNGLVKNGLLKIQGLYSTAGASTVDADNDALEGIGIFPTMFAWYPVLGVNPRWTNQLIAPDIGAQQMKMSFNSGQNWIANEALTNLITDNDKYRFSKDLFPLVTVIQSDPYHPCLTLIGTTQNGIFYSSDGMTTWKKLKDSEQITNISSFYFPPEGHIWVSTYGRGLWRLRMSRDINRCLNVSIPIPVLRDAMIFKIPMGISQPFGWPPKPLEWCPDCDYIILKHGIIKGMATEGSNLKELQISGGFLYQFNHEGKAIPLRIPNKYVGSSVTDAFQDDLLQLDKKEFPLEWLRGIVVKDKELKGVILSPKELEVKVDKVPYIEVFSKVMASGFPQVHGGEEIVIYGQGFETSNPVQSGVSLFIDEALVKTNITVDKNGAFKESFKMPYLSDGHYTIKVSQQSHNRLSEDRTSILVTSED